MAVPDVKWRNWTQWAGRFARMLPACGGLRRLASAAFVSASFVVFGAGAAADPWVSVGNAQARSDVELAAAVGLANNITMQWPLPWTGILGSLQDTRAIDEQPDYIRAAVGRLRSSAFDQLSSSRSHIMVAFDATNAPSVIRGFDALGRSKAQGQLIYEHVSDDTVYHLAVGSQTNSQGDRQKLVFDGSYIAHRFDDLVVYGGYLPHWWGPGWISALSLSNSARPIPQIGFSRVETNASDALLLSWLGPWQFEGFVGLLDGPRVNRNTVYVGMRFAFNPAPGLEIGLSRLTQMCGKYHSCHPFKDYVTVTNDPTALNNTNEQANIDIRYTGTAFSVPYALYAQFMNEDSNPIVHSGTSRLYGGSVWLHHAGYTGRFTLEYANTIATEDLWGNGARHGFAYNNFSYVDGMRYRGRSLGFSLDSDSILYSAQASVIDPNGITYTLSAHRALVSTPLNLKGNAVTTAPVRFTEVELRGAAPFQWGAYRANIDVSARYQTDQPRPAQGAQAAVEVALRFGL